METSFFYLIGAILSSGVAMVLLKMGVLRMGTRETVFFRSLSQTILVFLVVFLLFGTTKFSLPYRIEIIYPILHALMSGIAFITFTKGLKVVEVSIARPIMNLNFMITVVLGVLILGESLNPKMCVGIIMAIIAIILLSSASKSRPRKSLVSPQY